MKIINHFFAYSDPESRAWSDNEKLGCAVRLQCHCRNRFSTGVATISSALSEAISRSQIEFFFNEDRRPIGYVTWACLSPETESFIMENGRTSLHHSEWAERGTVWIQDIVSPYGHLKFILSHLRDNLFREQPIIRYWRTKGHRIKYVQIDRDNLRGMLRYWPSSSITCRCELEGCAQWNAPQRDTIFSVPGIRE